MKDRNKDESNIKKVIERELKCILTPATLMDAGLLTNDMPTYCLSIKEYKVPETGLPRFGIAFVDTAVAQFQLCHFDDDASRTVLETLVVQIKPKEVITELVSISQQLLSHQHNLDRSTLRMLKNVIQDACFTTLKSDNEFWTAETTQRELNSGAYFTRPSEFEDQHRKLI